MAAHLPKKISMCYCLNVAFFRIHVNDMFEGCGGFEGFDCSESCEGWRVCAIYVECGNALREIESFGVCFF